jgi:hypothetical protein
MEGQCAESAAICREALALDPSPEERTALHDCLYQSLLQAGDYAEGWRNYSLWAANLKHDRHVRYKARPFSEAVWDGREIPGQTLLVYADHGRGDAIQFLRFLPEVQRRSQANIVVECQPELVSLIAAMPEVRHCVPRTRFEDRPDVAFDAHIGLMGLGDVLAIRLDTLPNAVPYLPVEASLRTLWAERLRHYPGYKIGLCWSGDWSYPQNALRTYRLTDLGPLLENKDVTLFGLQVGPAAEEARRPPVNLRIIDLSGFLTDFRQTAAALLNLDLIITVDTSVAHLSGALGARTLLALPPVGPDWRWLQERSDSPWYPTVTLVRQQVFGDWEPVFATIDRKVRSRL